MSGLLGYAKRGANALEAYGKSVVTGQAAKRGLMQLNNELKAAESGDPQAAINLSLAFAPITAWHGSPHSFAAFDTSKIGTGEGAQAYGHGLYFAGNPSVGKWYARPNLDTSDPAQIAATYQAAHGDQAASQLAYEARGWDGPQAANALKAIKLLRSKAPLPQAATGHLYKAELSPDEEDLLDWDKPLGEQSPKVQGIVNDLAPGIGNDLTGEDFYKFLGEPESASQILHQSGIPGIKYLDGGSRASGTGTSNYVMFDPSNIKILGNSQ